MGLREKIVFFLKGICMGLADIVPGVSGGTIALITGIYERLIESIKSIDPRDLRSIDFPFLVPLAVGIGTAFLVASRVILYMLSNFQSYIFAFFFGLISASAVLIYRRTTRVDGKTIGLAVVGSVISFGIVGLEYLSLIHSPPMIFASGFLAISAMLLPGISGSFVLLFMGQYEYMLGALHDVGSRYPDIIIFMGGAGLSLFGFSKVIGWLLERDESATLSFLIGLMVGALRLPLEKITVRLNPVSISGLVASALVGIAAVTYLETNS